MQTIKTLVVVALLLTICFGAYKAMNAPDVEMPEDLKTWADQNGKDVLPDFEIPAITTNDTLSLPSGDSLAGTAKENSLPQFPAVDLTPGSSSGNLGSPTSANTANSASSIELPKLPSMNSIPSASQALNSTSSASATEASGPAIPFNPGLPDGSLGSPFPNSGASLTTDPNSSLADDLIDAGSGGLGSLPLLNTPEQTPSGTVETFTSLNPAGAADSKGPDSAAAEAKADQKSPPPSQPFSVARSEALQIASQGKLREALELLSQYYETPDLDYAEHTDLVDILDALTREVIYSDRHLLNSPYTVSAQDSLQSLAAQYNLNPEFLAAINKMGSSQALVPNTQIKVLEGPFHAQVSLSRGELTLFLRKLYAGRFPVSISPKNRPPQARYEIVDRRQDRTFYSANVRIPAGDPTNPYGGFWLSLGSDYSIHGSAEQVTSDLENAGCISLAPLDAADVYRILGKGSAVEIRP